MNFRSYTKRNLRRHPIVDLFSNLSVTNWIILINVVFFVLVLILFQPALETIDGKQVLVPNDFVSDNVALSWTNVAAGRIWTFLASMFMHGNFTHLFVNMLSLFFIGNFLEKIIGRKRFIWFYLVAGLVAGLFFILLSFISGADVSLGAVGASGAIFGLGGLLMILTPYLPVLVFFIIPMPLWIGMLFLLGFLWVVSSLAGLPIGNTAHLGGLVCGVIYGYYLKYKYNRKVMMLNRHFR